MNNKSLKKQIHDTHRDACLLRSAIIKIEQSNGSKKKNKEKKNLLFKEKLEIENKEKFFRNLLKEMEKK